jgi:hypothetical protein
MVRESKTLVATLFVVGCLIAAGVVVVSGLLDFTSQIQSERYRSTLYQCEDQNARHDSTLKELNFLLGRAMAGDRKHAGQIRASGGSATLLINDLAPKHNCPAYARSIVLAR